MNDSRPVLASSEQREWTWAAGIGAGLLLCTIAALARTRLSGQLGVSDRPAPWDFAVHATVACGFVLAAAAYLLAVRETSRKLGRRHLLMALAIHLCAAPATPLTSNDALMNLAHGRCAWLGINPYEHPPSDLPRSDPFRRVDWQGRLSAWGPVTTAVSAAAASLGRRAAAFAAWKVAMLTSALAAVLLAYAFASRLDDPEAVTGFVCFAWNPLLAWELSGQAHNDALLALPTVAFLWAAWRARPVRAAAILAFGIGAKHVLAPALAFQLLATWRRSRCAALLATVVALAALAASWAPFWTGIRTWRGLSVAVLPSAGRVENSFASIVALTGGLFDAREISLVIWNALTLVVVLASAALLATRTLKAGHAVSHAALLLTLVLCLGSAYVQPWYMTWLLPFCLWPACRAWRGWLAAYAATAPALYLTRAIGAVAILVVQGIGLLLVLRATREALGESSTESRPKDQTVVSDL